MDFASEQLLGESETKEVRNYRNSVRKRFENKLNFLEMELLGEDMNH